MNKQMVLDDKVHGAIDSYVLSRTCYLNNGTGNLFKYNNKTYIVTCKHIADGILSEKNFEVLLRKNLRIKKEKLDYKYCSSLEIDIGVIEILDENIEVNYYTIDNFGFIEDFREADFSKSNFFLLGYPYDLSFQTDRGKDILHISYMTLLKKNKPVTKDFLFVDYNRTVETNRIIESELNYKLPHPSGMSGSLLFQVKVFEGSKEKIWSPDQIKIVGIQQSWDKLGNWIKCSNIKYLKELLLITV